MNTPLPRRSERKKPDERQTRYDRAVNATRNHSARPVHAPKKKSGALPILGLIALLVIAGAVIAAFVVMGGIKGGSGSDETVAVVIEKGSGISSIASELRAQGVIKSELYFRLAAKLSGQETKLKAGNYQLEKNMPHDEILAALEKGEQAESNRVTIREGLTIDQTAALLADKLGISAEEFSQIAKNGASEYATRYPFLEGTYQNSLEGYLFPETYDFKKGATAREVLERMLAEYQKVWDSISTPNAKASSVQLSQQQIMTIASLIEKETKIPEERELVSSVIYNRINKDMKLQLCSSVQFLLPDGDSRNKLRLTNADIATPSPYNTYLHEGLPPGPIANPGKAAIFAALNPSDDDYIYFVLTGKDGSQTFAATESEFAKAKAKSKEVFGQ